MGKSYLKSTTSVVLSFAMTASPLAAQDITIDLNALESCVDMTDVEAAPVFPCLDVNGDIALDQDALEAVTLDPEMVPTDAPLADAPMEDAPLAEAPVVEEPVVEEPAAETPAVEEPVAEQPVADEPVVDAPEADAEAVIEAELPQIEPETETASPAADAETSTDMPGEEVVPLTDEVTAEAEATATTAEEAAPAEPVTTTEAPAEETTPAATVDAEAEAEAEVKQDIIIEEETAPAAAAAEMDSADLAEDGVAEDVEVEELSAEDVRSSSEDFTTKATGEARAESNQGGGQTGGLSNFEKALLLGLGAAVVGSVLNNGDAVVSNSGDRVVVERDGELVVLKDDDVLLRQPGAQVQTRTFDDGSTRTVVTRADGTQIVTIRSSDGRVLRRARILEDGTQVSLFDDTQESQAVVVSELPAQTVVETRASQSDVEALRRALMVQQSTQLDRTFSLRQIRNIEQVRVLAPEVQLDTVTFASGSAAIDPSQAEELTNLGRAIAEIISEDPSQVFLIEGHTDAVGDAGYNLALSDRRAETVALAMTEYFGVPPENLITQGYGESILKVQTLSAERENRRASIRNITSLLN